MRVRPAGGTVVNIDPDIDSDIDQNVDEGSREVTARFNPPPNWPEPPHPDWQPPAGWRPDPSWGPVPAGWNLWIEDGAPQVVRTERPLVASEQVPATGAGYQVPSSDYPVDVTLPGVFETVSAERLDHGFGPAPRSEPAAPRRGVEYAIAAAGTLLLAATCLAAVGIVVGVIPFPGL